MCDTIGKENLANFRGPNLAQQTAVPIFDTAFGFSSSLKLLFWFSVDSSQIWHASGDGSRCVILRKLGH